MAMDTAMAMVTVKTKARIDWPFMSKVILTIFQEPVRLLLCQGRWWQK